MATRCWSVTALMMPRWDRRAIKWKVKMMFHKHFQIKWVDLIILMWLRPDSEPPPCISLENKFSSLTFWYRDTAVIKLVLSFLPSLEKQDGACDEAPPLLLSLSCGGGGLSRSLAMLMFVGRSLHSQALDGRPRNKTDSLPVFDQLEQIPSPPTYLDVSAACVAKHWKWQEEVKCPKTAIIGLLLTDMRTQDFCKRYLLRNNCSL